MEESLMSHGKYGRCVGLAAAVGGAILLVPGATAWAGEGVPFVQLAGSPSLSYGFNTGNIDPTLEPSLDKAAVAFKGTASAVITGLVDSTDKMLLAIRANDLPAARQAWIDARGFYGRSLIFTYMDRDLLIQIDDWPQATDGFHGVEAGLFTPGAPPPLAEAEKLADLLHRLQRIFTPEPLYAHEVLIGMGIMTLALNDNRPLQDQSAISGTSLQDMQHDVQGIEEGWNTVFSSIMGQKNKGLADRVERQISEVKQLLSVPSLADVDQIAFADRTKLLQDSISDVAVDIGWRQPDFADTD
jgi:iron uptake system component EfeO